MTWLPLTLAVLGLTGVLLALISEPMQRRLPFTEALVALVLGVLAGPMVLDLVRVEEHVRDLLLLEGGRVLLAASVMAAALRYPADRLTGLVRPLLLLLAVVLPVAALVSGVAALAVGLPLVLALLVGACLAPTDPVLAAAVVTGAPAERTLAERVRALLTTESGANDGLGIVLVGVLVAAALPAAAVTEALGKVLWQVGAGTVIGGLLGWAAGWALRRALDHHDLGEGPELVYTLLLAAGVLGAARLVDAGGVLAVFVAGLAYNHMVPSTPRRHQEAVDEGINRYAVLPLFALLGVVLPWAGWRDLGWGAVLFVVAVLLLRRLPVVLALAGSLGTTRPQAVFMGWYGPMGVSALFYLAHARHEGVDDPAVFAAVTLVVTVSAVVFGLTASPGRRLYAARVGHEGTGRQEAQEEAPS
ncbi:cation:proton antiporter domain-containing protein [Ornithinimicrobium sediminis]|uniref:cation:proton antiporter domain-containing protein n=1 Tax=Ornithinimicrobium sediminis TaxID=2904603 RepID=UPI001E5FC63E|nr:cation:proton antiporter [Ornithinimicrobium sediminis]MCE0487448.1 cation:proton antiporter [Ornithinimicrobium sediminis]